MKRLALLLLFPAALSFAQVPSLPAPPPPAVAAKAWLLYDATSGQTIAAANAQERIEPASLTKLMTAYLAFAALKQKRIEPGQTIPVSERAWKAEGSRMFIEPGRPVTVDELLRGMIVQSGNDACIALAEAIAGSEEAFAQLMNREARRLGMANTNFVNATGLPHAQHYTTAQDLALLTRALIRDFPEHYALYALKDYSYNNITQYNRNRLLALDPTVDGVKTGFTEGAGWCLVASARRGERRLISIVLGAGSDSARALENQKLLNYGFQFYDAVRFYQKGQTVATLKLWKGAQGAVKAGFVSDLYLTLPRGQAERVKATLERQEPLLAPVAAGQRVGTVRLTLDGKALGDYPLLALEPVAVASVIGRAWDSLRLMFN